MPIFNILDIIILQEFKIFLIEALQNTEISVL